MRISGKESPPPGLPTQPVPPVVYDELAELITVEPTIGSTVIVATPGAVSIVCTSGNVTS